MALPHEEDGEADESFDQNSQEAQSLLPSASISEDSPRSGPISPRPINTHQRQSSFSKKTLDGSSRTPNRVRFNVPESAESNDGVELQNRRGQDGSPDWLDNEDYFSHANGGTRRSSTGQRAPLLTGIEAPSITVATETFDGSADDEMAHRRPKSGVRGAFMNMANSIM